VGVFWAGAFLAGAFVTAFLATAFFRLAFFADFRAGFAAFLAPFATTRRFGAARLERTALREAVRFLTVAFRLPPAFRAAFRLAIARPFRSIAEPFLTLTVTDK
jgi:hypothetical protein